MRLIFSLLDSPAFGGAEQYLLDHLYTLQKQKNLHVLLATNNLTVKDKVRKEGNKIALLDFPYRLDATGNWKGLVKYFVYAPLALIWFLNTFKKLHKNYSDITCYLPGFSDRMLFSPFVKFFNHTLVWLEFGPLQPLFEKNWGFPKLLYTIGERFPDKVVVISNYTKRCLLRDTNIQAEKVVRIYPTTPTISYQQLTRLRTKGKLWRKHHNLTHKKIIVFVGRLALEKEVDLLIRAFKKVLNTINTAHLVIVGDGPERSFYETLSKKLNLNDHIVFTGFVSDDTKRQILATSNVFVFPSAWELEGFGMTTIEAMATEIPVISSGNGPQAEVVEDNVTGYIFHPHTPKNLAKKITTVLQNSQKTKKVAQHGRGLVSTKFKEINQLSKLFNNFER